MHDVLVYGPAEVDTGIEPLGDIEVIVPSVRELDVSIEIVPVEGAVGPTTIEELDMGNGAVVSTVELVRPRDGVDVGIPSVKVVDVSLEDNAEDGSLYEGAVAVDVL